MTYKIKGKRYGTKSSAAASARRRSASKRNKFKFRVRKLKGGGYAVNKAGCQCVPRRRRRR